jgi:hypothetical protein
MIGLCINRHDCSTTILLSTEIQACHSGATASISTAENNLESRYYAYTTSECNQEAFQHHPKTAYPGTADRTLLLLILRWIQLIIRIFAKSKRISKILKMALQLPRPTQTCTGSIYPPHQAKRRRIIIENES